MSPELWPPFGYKEEQLSRYRSATSMFWNLSPILAPSAIAACVFEVSSDLENKSEI